MANNEMWLYQRYAGICVEEKIYELLEEKGIIGKELGKAYFRSNGTGRTSSLISSSLKKGEYSDGPEKLFASYGEKLFLVGDMECVLFYPDFMVICKSGGDRHNKAKPVAIPLTYLKTVTNLGYSIKLYFENDKTIDAKLFTTATYSRRDGSNEKTYLQGCNWSFETNQILLGGALSYSPSRAYENAARIYDVIDKLMEKRVDFKRREAAVMGLECDVKTTNKLLQNMYLPMKIFVDSLLESLPAIEKASNNDEFVAALKKIKEAELKNQSEKEELQKKQKDLKQQIQEKENEISNASFFKKGNLKKELKLLKKELDKVTDQECQLEIPETLKKQALICLLKQGEIRQENQEKRELAKQVYNACAAKNLYKVETAEEKVLFEMVCSNLALRSDLRDPSILQLGKEALDNHKADETIEDKKARMLVTIQFEQIYKEEKRKSAIVGREKYLKKVREDKETAEARSKLMQLGYSLGLQESCTTAIKSDWAIAGGIAQGLGGIGAGIMAAANVQEQNRRAEESAAQARAHGRQLMQDASAMGAAYSSEAYSAATTIEAIEKRLCDVAHKEMYYEYLSCGVDSYEINPGGTMLVNARVNFSKEPLFNGLPIVIDGSLLIKVMNGDTQIGEAYLCAPGFDVPDLNKVGFNKGSFYKIAAIPFEGEFEEGVNYTFEFEPVNMWMIEK